jgi:hypothetical protein
MSSALFVNNVELQRRVTVCVMGVARVQLQQQLLCVAIIIFELME